MRGFEGAPPDIRALLPQRVSELGLKLEGSPLERYVQALEKQIEAAHPRTILEIVEVALRRCGVSA
jgi:hypothetical protein